MQLGIARTPEEYAPCEGAVASRPPRFLVVRLGRRRERPVNDEPNVRLVDAHAEGAGGHDHIHTIVQEILQRRGAPGLGQSRMVRRRPWPARTSARATASVSPRVGTYTMII